MKVVFTIGIQGSGKSTYAKKLCENSNWKRISRDDLRLSLDNQQFNPKNEKFITIAEDALLFSALEEGYNCVIDQMNLNEDRVKARKQKILERFPYTEFETKSFLDVSLEKCIENDRKRPNSVGEDVITNTYMRYFDKREDLRDQSMELDGAVISSHAYLIDIDGTLAKMYNRKPFEFHKVGQDKCREDVAEVVRNLYKNKNYIIIMSGRDSICRPETEVWLDKHKIPYHKLYMRAEGDNRKDAVIKRELFDKHIAGKGFYIVGAFDDRPVMCRMYRQMGITVFNMDDRLYHTNF